MTKTHDIATALRHPLSVATVGALLLTLLAATSASHDHPALYALAGWLVVATAVLGHLRLELRRPRTERNNVIVLADRRAVNVLADPPLVIDLSETCEATVPPW